MYRLQPVIIVVKELDDKDRVVGHENVCREGVRT
jgi:hypothetical protein